MLHRYGSVAEALARRLLAMQPGERLDSIGQLASTFGTGRGTVQSALRLLTEQGAITLESRGRQGSFVSTLNRERLLEIAGLSPIIGVMPVPYSLRFQGLASGLTRAFETARLPLILAHLRGGRSRLHFLRTGRCDFAVISRLAWQEEASTGDLRLLHTFGSGSNVGDHVLLLKREGPSEIVDGMRVGVDPTSHDHVRLTMEECRGKAVQLVEISYAQALPKLLAGEIDAALWDAGVALPAGTPLITRPLHQRDSAGDPDTEAVMVIRAEAAALGDLLQRCIDPAFVTGVQRRVVSGEELPVF